MTPHEPHNEVQADDDEVCPHCGAVLELARAIENDRSVLRAKAARSARPAPTPNHLVNTDDPNVA